MFYYGRMAYAYYRGRGLVIIHAPRKDLAVMTRRWWVADDGRPLRSHLDELGFDLVPDWVWGGWLIVGWVMRAEPSARP